MRQGVCSCFWCVHAFAARPAAAVEAGSCTDYVYRRRSVDGSTPHAARRLPLLLLRMAYFETRPKTCGSPCGGAFHSRRIAAASRVHCSKCTITRLAIFAGIHFCCQQLLFSLMVSPDCVSTAIIAALTCKYPGPGSRSAREREAHIVPLSSRGHNEVFFRCAATNMTASCFLRFCAVGAYIGLLPTFFAQSDSLHAKTAAVQALGVPTKLAVVCTLRLLSCSRLLGIFSERPRTT